MSLNYDNDEISLMEIMEILFKRKHIIIIAIIISMMGSILFGYIANNIDQEIEYDATTNILILNEYDSPINPEEIGEGYIYFQDRNKSHIIPMISAYAHSRALIMSIIQELDIKNDDGKLITARELTENIKITDMGNLIRCEVVYKDKDLAEKIANMIPEKLIEITSKNNYIKDYKIIVIDKAIGNKIDNKESNPFIIIIVSGFISGIIIGIILIFIINIISKKVKSKYEIHSMGLDIDLVFKIPLTSHDYNKIISLGKLSDAKHLIIGVNEMMSGFNDSDFISIAKSNSIETEIICYTDDKFLLKAKESERTFIIVEEDISDIKKIKEIAKLINKYKIKVSVIYIER